MSEYVQRSLDEMIAIREKGFFQQKNSDLYNCRIVTGNGKLTTEDGISICEAAKKYGIGEIALTSRQTVEIIGIPYENVDPLKKYLKDAKLVMGGIGPRIRPIVACKGTTCSHGVIDTFALGEKLHQLFFLRYKEVELPGEFEISLSGCPNKCVKPQFDDIGIVGQFIPKIQAARCVGCESCVVIKTCELKAAYLSEGKIHIDTNKCTHCGSCIKQCEHKVIEEGMIGYKIYVGGSWQNEATTGQPLSKIVLREEQIGRASCRERV